MPHPTCYYTYDPCHLDSDMNEARLERLYRARLPIYRRAIEQVRHYLSGVIADFSGEGLFRVASLSCRIKEPSSLKLKAADRGIENEEIVFERIMDIAGARLVTNNLSDSRSVHDRVKALHRLEYDEGSLQEFTESPQTSGYRGIHFTVYCEVDYKGECHRVPCEIQIRTLLQDAWAVLTHQDVYKSPSDLPPLMVTLSSRLADQLAVLDNVAQDIRDALAQGVHGVRVSSTAPISKNGLAKLGEEWFGRVLYDYQLQIWLTALREEGIETMGDAERSLPSDEMLTKMQDIHETVWGGRDIPADTLLFYAVKIMGGASRGYVDFGRAIRQEHDDLMALGRREILAELPDGLDELIESLQSGRMTVSDLWTPFAELGGVVSCRLCETSIFSADLAFNGLSSHYGEEREELLDLLNDAVYSEAIETESDYRSRYCHHCAHLLTSDHT